MNTEYEVSIEEYDITCEITHYEHEDGSPTADNPWDFFGYTEVSYVIIDVQVYDDKTEEMIPFDVDKFQKDILTCDMDDAIQQKLSLEYEKDLKMGLLTK